MRRVVRYELDGSVTVIADSFEGKRLNSPNDAVPHPDGSIWFTDPPYGGQLYEGAPDVAGGPSNAAGRLNPTPRPAAGIGRVAARAADPVLPLGPGRHAHLVVTEDQVPDPNGLCFSPDYKTLYVASTGKGPGDTGPGGKGNIFVFDVNDDGTLANHRLFTDCMVDGVKCGAGWRALRRQRQCLGVEQCRPQRGLQRRHRLDPRGQAHRPHPATRDLRQPLLRRPEAQPAVHGGEPVALRGLYPDPGRGAGLIAGRSQGGVRPPAVAQ